jgi:tartrate-resistant acid phosphatase type 5
MWLPLLLALALPHGEVLRIAVVGDTGAGTAAVSAGLSRVGHLDAIVLAGDNFYPCGVPRWSLYDPLMRLGVPIFPVLGNHDACPEAESQIRVDGNWRFPARSYEVSTRFADFFFLDTTPVVRGRITAVAVAPSDKPWQIAVGHHPILSSGYHGYFPRVEVARMRATVLPALREAGVDLYICGHDHHLELTRGRDMLYLVSGAGSAPIRPVKLRLRTVFPTEIRREPVGFALLEITASSLRVRFYEGSGKPRSEWISARVRRDAPAE